MSKSRKNKYYNLNSKFNPAIQARKIDKIRNDLEIHKRQIDAISKIHDIHIAHLANFARHDIKNAIQNMDSILSTSESGSFEPDQIQSLSASVSIIRNTIDNFARLVPYSTTGAFTIDTLMVAVELLARYDMRRNDIEVNFSYPKNCETEIKLPFQAILQMLNNLIINSIKSLEGILGKKISVVAQITNDKLNIQISDNGRVIEKNDNDKIFEYGYSTTGGSGIGLFHARYLCCEFNGEITVDLDGDQLYTKTFIIILPIRE